MSKALCLYAFEVLQAELNHQTPKPLSTYLAATGESLDSFPAKAPLFVTWDKDDDLRGCIGTFVDQPIEAGVARFSLTAALRDSRFAPISKSELPSLTCSITLLHNFQPLQDPLAWHVGKHGLKIDIGHYNSGTFLPNVAPEQDWDQQATLFHLLRKASYPGVDRRSVVDFYRGALKDGTMYMESYEGLKYTLSYDEFSKVQAQLS